MLSHTVGRNGPSFRSDFNDTVWQTGSLKLLVSCLVFRIVDLQDKMANMEQKLAKGGSIDHNGDSKAPSSWLT